MLIRTPTWMAPLTVTIPFLSLLLLTAGPLQGEPSLGHALDTGSLDEKSGMVWHDIRTLGVEGQGWPEAETKSPYDRLPAKAEGVVRPPVWSLSRHSAGLAVRFQSDTPQLRARWTLTSSKLAMEHMAATGVSGLDLYVRHEGQWRWVNVGRPKAQTNETEFFKGVSSGIREYLLYLPLYNGVSSVEIAIPKGARIAQAPTWGPGDRRPIVFYGTSITHGACASRPGMCHPALLERRFDRPVINLGFSGNGTMDASMADLLSELDPAVYVIDCLPNMVEAQVRERTEPLVRRLRKARPTTPILLVEDRTYANTFFFPDKQRRHETSRAALRQAYENLQKAGVTGLYYLEGANLLGADGEDTVDSSHPTDLGFMRQADAMAEVLAPLLK